MSQSQKPGLLLIGNFLSSHVGSRSVSEDLAVRLQQRGWPVIMTSHVTNRLMRLGDMLATTWQARHRYDVAQVDIYSGKAFIWAEAVCVLLRRLGKPYILTLHGGNLPNFAIRHPQRVQWLLHSAAVVTTPSRYLDEKMARYCKAVYLLPNPIDLTAYSFRPRECVASRLVWLRTFHRTYNPELAVEVVANLRPDFPELRLLMVGPDKDGSLNRTKERARQLGVLDSIEFTGGVPHSDVPTWLQRGDVFLNTTNVDNTPVSVLEAMACGLPVISTNVGGIPYLLEHEQDALLVPPNNPQAMAAAQSRLLTEPGLAERLSHQARQKVEQFDWSAILPQWEKLILTAR